MVFLLGKAILLIGKDDQSGIYLDDEQISSNHASIVYNSGDYVLYDNGSFNGTFVNGIKIKKQILCHNDQISFGPYHFSVDLEGDQAESNLPASEPAHLERKGQSYDRLIQVNPVHGNEEAGSIQVMMEREHQQGPPSEPLRSKKPLLYTGIVALIAFAALAILFSNHELKKKDRIVKIESSQIADLQKINGASAARINKLEENLKQRSAALSRSSEDLKKMEAERANRKQQNTQNLEALHKATEDLKVSTGKVAAFNKTETAKINDDAKKAEIQLPSREQVASRLEPVPYIPLLKIPIKISIVQDTTVPVMKSQQLAGTLTLKSGQSLPIVGAEQDVVFVNVAGEKIRLPKGNTDFNSALDAANLSVKKANDRLYTERELRINKMVEAETKVVEQEKLEKESLIKSKVPIYLTVKGFYMGGVLGQKLGAQGWMWVLLTGVDIANISIDGCWRGDAYAMGLVPRPWTDQQCQHFTADWKEFSSFVKSGSQHDPVSIQIVELALKQAKEVYGQIMMLQKQMATDLLIKEAAPIGALDMRKTNESHVALAQDNFFKIHALKMETGAQLAIDFSKNPSLDPRLKSLLQKITSANGVFLEHDFNSFYDEIRNIERQANELKGVLTLSIKGFESQIKEPSAQ